MYTIRVFTSYRELEPKLESGRTEPIVPSEPRQIVSTMICSRSNIFLLLELSRIILHLQQQPCFPTSAEMTDLMVSSSFLPAALQIDVVRESNQSLFFK